ncbi:uncharacterized [Tachysurus ichikawai]
MHAFREDLRSWLGFRHILLLPAYRIRTHQAAVLDAEGHCGQHELDAEQRRQQQANLLTHRSSILLHLTVLSFLTMEPFFSFEDFGRCRPKKTHSCITRVHFSQEAGGGDGLERAGVIPELLSQLEKSPYST